MTCTRSPATSLTPPSRQPSARAASSEHANAFAGCTSVPSAGATATASGTGDIARSTGVMRTATAAPTVPTTASDNDLTDVPSDAIGMRRGTADTACPTSVPSSPAIALEWPSSAIGGPTMTIPGGTVQPIGGTIDIVGSTGGVGGATGEAAKSTDAPSSPAISPSAVTKNVMCPQFSNTSGPLRSGACAAGVLCRVEPSGRAAIARGRSGRRISEVLCYRRCTFEPRSRGIGGGSARECDSGTPRQLIRLGHRSLPLARLASYLPWSRKPISAARALRHARMNAPCGSYALAHRAPATHPRMPVTAPAAAPTSVAFPWSRCACRPPTRIRRLARPADAPSAVGRSRRPAWTASAHGASRLRPSLRPLGRAFARRPVGKSERGREPNRTGRLYVAAPAERSYPGISSPGTRRVGIPVPSRTRPALGPKRMEARPRRTGALPRSHRAGSAR